MASHLSRVIAGYNLAFSHPPANSLCRPPVCSSVILPLMEIIGDAVVLSVLYDCITAPVDWVEIGSS